MPRPQWLEKFAARFRAMSKRRLFALVGALLLSIELMVILIAILTPNPPSPGPGGLKWHAKLKANNKECGATVIAENWLLTAAHCVDRGEAIRWQGANPADMAAMLLDKRKKMLVHTARNPPGGRSTPACERAILHKDYTHNENMPSPHDIALIHVPVHVDGVEVSNARWATPADAKPIGDSYFPRWHCPNSLRRMHRWLGFTWGCTPEPHALTVKLTSGSWPGESDFVLSGAGSEGLIFNDSGSGLTTTYTYPTVLLGVANYRRSMSSDHYARVSTHAEWIQDVLDKHTPWSTNHSPDHGDDCEP
jgi:hypothetical protein